MKLILALFILYNAQARSQSIVRLNYEAFSILKSAFDQIGPYFDEITGERRGRSMRPNEFDSRYGLFYRILEEIEEIYDENILSEGHTNFRDIYFFATYLYFDSSSYLQEDHQIPNIAPLLERSCQSIKTILTNYNWEVEQRSVTDSQSPVLFSQARRNLSQLNCFNGKEKRPIPDFLSRSKVFLGPIASLISEINPPDNLKDFFESLQRNSTIVLETSGDDTNRAIDQAGRNILNDFYRVKDDFILHMLNLKREGSLEFYNYKNIHFILVTLAELKSYSGDYVPINNGVNNPEGAARIPENNGSFRRRGGN